MIKTGLEQALDHVRGLTWQFQRPPFKYPRNMRRGPVSEGVGAPRPCHLEVPPASPEREQTPRAANGGGKGLVRGPRGLRGLWRFSQRGKSHEAGGTEVWGSGTPRGPGRALAGPVWRSLTAGASATQDPRSLGKPGCGSDPAEHRSRRRELPPVAAGSRSRRADEMRDGASHSIFSSRCTFPQSRGQARGAVTVLRLLPASLGPLSTM